MGKQLSVEASGVFKDNAPEEKVPAFLLVEGRFPIRLDIIAALRKRFPGAETNQLYPQSVQELEDISWNQYDLILISCPESIDEQLSWLNIIKQRSSTNHEPLVVVMTGSRQDGRKAVWRGADLYLQNDVLAMEFAIQLDVALEVDRLFRQYPVLLPEWHLLEALHDSENAVIFLVEDKHGKQAVIKRFKFDISGLSPAAVQHFMDDAETLIKQDGNGLVSLIDAGTTDNALYLVMEYVGGVTLKYMLDEQESINQQQRINWFVQIYKVVSSDS